MLCPHVSATLILTVLLIPPGRVQRGPAVVEEELVFRAGDPAFQERHEVPAVNHSGERSGDAECGEGGVVESRVLSFTTKEEEEERSELEEQEKGAEGRGGGVGRGGRRGEEWTRTRKIPLKTQHAFPLIPQFINMKKKCNILQFLRQWER